MACGLPVVTSTKSGAAELVLAERRRARLSAGDVAALAAHMRTLLDATTRARLGDNARRAVLPLSPAAITLQLVLLYRDLLAATVQAKAARGNRVAQALADAPSTTRSAETVRPPAGAASRCASNAAGIRGQRAAGRQDPSPVADASAAPSVTDAAKTPPGNTRDDPPPG